MKISTQHGKYKQKETDALIVPIAYKEKAPKGLPKTAAQLLKDAVDRKEFSGKKREFLKTTLPVSGKKGLRHVLFIGIGKPGDLHAKEFGRVVGQAVRSAQASKAGTVVFLFRDILADNFEDVEHLAEIVAAYANIASYEFSEFLKRKKHQIKTLNVVVENKEELAAVKKGARDGALISEAVNDSRDLANKPSNEMTPKHLVAQTRALIKKDGSIKMKVLGEKEMERLGMGALLGVAKGSAQEAQFIILEYFGGKAKDQPYVVVGKGITFDTGGISIKPSSSMDEMKFDMAGGAAAIGILRAAAALKLPLNVVCLVPASENMPGQNAYKPGDVLTAKDGTTIEVLNTDAEGRLILADALVYAREYKPKAVIDLATLTGACAVALYDSAAGMFTHDYQLAHDLKEASKRSGDTAWRMPMPAEYKNYLKSKVADLANIGSTSYGGAITAACFLNHFVANKYPWAHIDIAGVAWAKGGKKHIAPGSTGAGIRVVVDWLRNQRTE